MNWQEILTILVPMFSMMGWMYNRIDKKFEVMMQEIKELRKDMQSLDTRVSRIEGHLFGGPLHWEPRVMHKKEE